MIKKAFKMKIYPDCHVEYQKRHDVLWPEMKAMLVKYGAQTYSIFLDEATSTLFAYLEIEDESLWSQTATTEINQKWWLYMADIMETNLDNSPNSIELTQVFDL
ncbi:L-rhamnose mutarotase [Carnobacterium gallinarum]|uniref:L-rhamnose mutarotase n=1 Tax=Carnobacterium gallinarum TaxID=2749 RepID=UPI0005519864|nr:L-rhamnose mutarotase [Carnobacterium gallinarum]